MSITLVFLYGSCYSHAVVDILDFLINKLFSLYTRTILLCCVCCEEAEEVHVGEAA